MRVGSLVVLLLACQDVAPAKKRRRKGRSELSTFTPIRIDIGDDGTQQLDLRLPSKHMAISSPKQLFKHVSHAYETVVAPHQAGLTDARQTSLESVPLSPEEAWHHYEAGKQGIIDSARFLVAFNVVPSLQQGGGSRLHAACARGLLDQVRALLEAADERAVEAAAEDGTTPLHAAAAAGHAAVVALLLEAGADPQAAGRNGATALHVASAMGHLAVVEALVASGATLVDAPHRFALCTALHFAAEMGHTKVVRTLCAAGADANARKTTGGTPVHTAADCNQSAAVRALLAPPCSGDASRLLNGDTTPLYLAAQRGFTQPVAALLDGGAVRAADHSPHALPAPTRVPTVRLAVTICRGLPDGRRRRPRRC